MEDQKIKDLFSNFQPELSSSFQFMQRLEKNMETVECLKQHNVTINHRYKLAAVIATFTGLIVGIILATLLPLIGDWVATFDISIPRLQISSITVDYTVIGWIFIAIACIIIALNTYEIALVKLAEKIKS